MQLLVGIRAGIGPNEALLLATLGRSYVRGTSFYMGNELTATRAIRFREFSRLRENLARVGGPRIR